MLFNNNIKITSMITQIYLTKKIDYFNLKKKLNKVKKVKFLLLQSNQILQEISLKINKLITNKEKNLGVFHKIMKKKHQNKSRIKRINICK